LRAQDPDIVALATQLGLRGFQYHSFQNKVTGVVPSRADSAERVEDDKAIPLPAVSEPPPATRPAAAEPAPAAIMPVAAVAIAPVPSAACATTQSPPAFPLIGQALARVSGAPMPAGLPDAARPFAALRLAIGGDSTTAGR